MIPYRNIYKTLVAIEFVIIAVLLAVVAVLIGGCAPRCSKTFDCGGVDAKIIDDYTTKCLEQNNGFFHLTRSDCLFYARETYCNKKMVCND